MGSKMKLPIILSDKNLSESEVEALISEHSISEIVDLYDGQLQELERIHYTAVVGHSWVFYPWAKKLLHTVDAEALFALRTNRNKNLITIDEQKVLHEKSIGIAGMSVGAGIAIGLTYSGIGANIKIADFDTLDTSNLNRLRESLLNVGRSKVELAAERIYEVDPFANIEAYDKGLDEDNIDLFLGNPKLDVVFDEIDDFKMKVLLRKRARELKVAVVMLTSLGDNILIDIERYDTDSDLGIFNDLLGDLTDEILAKDSFTIDDIRKYSVELVGVQYIPQRAIDSVREIGRSLVGRPQLYGTIAIDGGLGSYITREIVLGDQLTSGRYYISFSDFFAH